MNFQWLKTFAFAETQRCAEFTSVRNNVNWSLCTFNGSGHSEQLGWSLDYKDPTKVKNDHRSKFSNLSNWKEKPEKNQDFNGIRTRDLRDTGAMLYQLSYEATHWERGQFITLIYNRSSNIWIISYILHIKDPTLTNVVFKPVLTKPL